MDGVLYCSGGIQGEQSGQLAIIARCNDTLFVEMARVVESGNKLRVGFAGVSMHIHMYIHSNIAHDCVVQNDVLD